LPSQISKRSKQREVTAPGRSRDPVPATSSRCAGTQFSVPSDWKFGTTRSPMTYPVTRTPAKSSELEGPRSGVLDDDWPDVLAALRRGIKQPNDAAAARAAIGYVQLVYRRQLQQPTDEQPRQADPLDVASMSREQRDALKRRLLAEHPHLAEQLGLELSG
jgi:hypothetical protein